jgi:broad specificity phosphatase PhoE
MSVRRNLILVRHSAPEIVPDIPAREWQLSEEGRSRCEALADELLQYRPRIIATSVEYKARETAVLVGARVGATVREVEGLHEHERAGGSFRATREEFRQEVEAFFAQRRRRVMGEETAIKAYARFARAIDALVKGTTDGDVVVISHGRVIALFTAVRAGVDPFDLWKRLGLPSMIVFSLPGFELERVVEEVE